MGAADVVPGVSGGTVAFITGIYEELLSSIKSVNSDAIKLLLKGEWAAFWQHTNANFLVVLLLGIVSSIAFLARLVSYCLENHPLLVWSFFFGLIAASSLHMMRQIKRWRLDLLVAIALGVFVAYGVTELKPSELSPNLLMVFGAGCIAICAMILPGISGSFILVLLGMYGYILQAVKDFQIAIIMVFVAGCGIGLLSFSHLLSWLFKRFHDATLALLTGFLIGSLNLVWPWKNTLSYYTSSSGKPKALEQENVLPATYELLSGAESFAISCMGLMVLGAFLVLLLEKVGEKVSKAS